MKNSIICEISAIGDEGQGVSTLDDTETALEVVNVSKEGVVQVGLCDREERFYISFSLAELTAKVIAFGRQS